MQALDAGYWIVPLLAFYTHMVHVCIYKYAYTHLLYMYIHDCMGVHMQPFDGRWQSILRSMPVAPVASV